MEISLSLSSYTLLLNHIQKVLSGIQINSGIKFLAFTTIAFCQKQGIKISFLSDGKVGRFDPYIEIADSWERLRSNCFVKQDISLIYHEYFEARFEALYRTDYNRARKAAVLSDRDWDPDEFITTPEISWRP